jgi:hypothetical protein
MADTKHGLALFPGTEEEVKERIECIKRKCHGPAEGLTIAQLGFNVNRTEFKYMKETRRLPRRVSIRLSK